MGGNSATDDEWGEDSIESDTDYNSGDGMGSNTGASSGGQLGDYDDTRFATGRWLGPFHELVHQHPHSGPPQLLPARRRRMQSLAQEAEGARFDLRGKVWKPVGSELEEARIEQEYQDYQRYGRSVGTREGVGGPPPGRSARAP